jgi:ribosome biogenesis GTPase A
MNWTLVRILCLIAALPRKEPSCSAFVFSKALVKQEGFQNRWRERLPGAFLRRPIYVSDASETYTHTNSAISGDGRTPPGFRSGFVSIIGNPNVGKSTILNRILDQNLCICSPKPQTTRHRILGVKTTQQYQIVFSDTPGAIQDPAYALQEAMIKSTHKAVNDCDLILLMSDVFGESLYDQKLFERYWFH